MQPKNCDGRAQHHPTTSVHRSDGENQAGTPAFRRPPAPPFPPYSSSTPAGAAPWRRGRQLPHRGTVTPKRPPRACHVVWLGEAGAGERAGWRAETGRHQNPLPPNWMSRRGRRRQRPAARKCKRGYKRGAHPPPHLRPPLHHHSDSGKQERAAGEGGAPTAAAATPVCPRRPPGSTDPGRRGGSGGAAPLLPRSASLRDATPARPLPPSTPPETRAVQAVAAVVAQLVAVKEEPPPPRRCRSGSSGSARGWRGGGGAPARSRFGQGRAVSRAAQGALGCIIVPRARRAPGGISQPGWRTPCRSASETVASLTRPKAPPRLVSVWRCLARPRSLAGRVGTRTPRRRCATKRVQRSRGRTSRGLNWNPADRCCQGRASKLLSGGTGPPGGTTLLPPPAPPLTLAARGRHRRGGPLPSGSGGQAVGLGRPWGTCR